MTTSASKLGPLEPVIVVTLIGRRAALERNNGVSCQARLASGRSLVRTSPAESADSTVPEPVTIARPEPSKALEPVVKRERRDESGDSAGFSIKLNRSSTRGSLSAHCSLCKARSGHMPTRSARVQYARRASSLYDSQCQ